MGTNSGPSADAKRTNTIAKTVASLTRKRETDSAEGPAGLGDTFRKLVKMRETNLGGSSPKATTYSTGVKQRVQNTKHRHQ